eukprot:7596127-Heterocapsa_arctica.AAC.1
MHELAQMKQQLSQISDEIGLTRSTFIMLQEQVELVRKSARATAASSQTVLNTASRVSHLSLGRFRPALGWRTR